MGCFANAEYWACNRNRNAKRNDNLGCEDRCRCTWFVVLFVMNVNIMKFQSIAMVELNRFLRTSKIRSSDSK
jgi:hypothetical protein